MVKNNIKVFARLKPDSSQNVKYEISRRNVETEELFLDPKTQFDEGRSPHRLKFKFHKILNEFVNQEGAFDNIVKPVVSSVLKGYNGTIFAYGQTGSGKTYTMTGSPDDYNGRGIIPRSIQLVFQAIKESPDVLYTVFISYLEIYNECGFDLLDPKHDATKLEDLQRVTTLEDSHGKNHLRNLSVIPVTAEADALRLLFLGDTNRTIAETPMNPFSSRSHCIFTIHIGSRLLNSKAVRRAKLHLVDLAGSERIAKAQLSCTKSLSEAKHINLSLHYLEQVIIALSEAGRPHVPYRNSMLTSVLRDSLGGNCLTTMVATLSLRSENLEETISTCRFAQRVAMINNEVMINEEMDPQQEVLSLRAEINTLKSQLMIYSYKDLSGTLTQDQMGKCKQAVSDYLQGITQELEIDADMRQIRLCFRMLKAAVLANVNSPRARSIGSESSTNTGGRKQSKPTPTKDDSTLETYKQLIKQRDCEISILINLLRIEKRKTETKTSEVQHTLSPASSCDGSILNLSQSDEFNPPINTAILEKLSSTTAVSDAEKEALQFFLKDAPQAGHVRSCQRTLSKKMEEAMQVADRVEYAKQNILVLRNEITSNSSSLSSSLKSTDQLPELKNQLQIYQQTYRENIQRLQKLKTETDHIKHGLERANVQLIHQFKDWWIKAQSKFASTNQLNNNHDIVEISKNIAEDDIPNVQNQCHSCMPNLLQGTPEGFSRKPIGQFSEVQQREGTRISRSKSYPRVKNVQEDQQSTTSDESIKQTAAKENRSSKETDVSIYTIHKDHRPKEMPEFGLGENSTSSDDRSANSDVPTEKYYDDIKQQSWSSVESRRKKLRRLGLKQLEEMRRSLSQSQTAHEHNSESSRDCICRNKINSCSSSSQQSIEQIHPKEVRSSIESNSDTAFQNQYSPDSPKSSEELFSNITSTTQHNDEQYADQDYLHHYLSQQNTPTSGNRGKLTAPINQQIIMEKPFRGHYESFVKCPELGTISEHSISNVTSQDSVQCSFSRSNLSSKSDIYSVMTQYKTTDKNDVQNQYSDTALDVTRSATTTCQYIDTNVPSKKLNKKTLSVEHEPEDSTEIVCDDAISPNGLTWEEFRKQIPLTGDEDVDSEIISFYQPLFESNNV